MHFINFDPTGPARFALNLTRDPAQPAGGSTRPVSIPGR